MQYKKFVRTKDNIVFLRRKMEVYRVDCQGDLEVTLENYLKDKDFNSVEVGWDETLQNKLILNLKTSRGKYFGTPFDDENAPMEDKSLYNSILGLLQEVGMNNLRFILGPTNIKIFKENLKLRIKVIK